MCVFLVLVSREKESTTVGKPLIPHLERHREVSYLKEKHEMYKLIKYFLAGAFVS